MAKLSEILRKIGDWDLVLQVGALLVLVLVGMVGILLWLAMTRSPQARCLKDPPLTP